MRCPETCKRLSFLVDPLRFWTLGRLYYNVLNYQVLIEQISPYLRCKTILGKAVDKGHLSEMLIHHKVPILIHQSVDTNQSCCFWVLTFSTFEPTIDSRFLHKMPKPKCFSSYSQAFFCTFSANSGFPISFAPSIHCFPRKHKPNIHTSIAASRQRHNPTTKHFPTCARQLRWKTWLHKVIVSAFSPKQTALEGKAVRKVSTWAFHGRFREVLRFQGFWEFGAH